MLDHTRNGGTKDNPVLVEEGPLLAATKRQKVELKLNCVPVQTILFWSCDSWQPFFLFVFQSKDNVKLDALKNVQTASSAQTMFSDPKAIPCHLKETQLAENATPALDCTG